MPFKRVKVIIKGRVQGVFFRQSTYNQAERLGVFGYVKNRRDGNSVEAIFEGEVESVEKIISWCKVGPKHAIVDSIEIKDETQNGKEFTNFSIKY